MNKLLNDIGQSIEDALDLKGMIGLYNGEHIELDSIDVAVKSSNMDRHMVVYVIGKMFKENKITFVGDCDKDIEYLKKLLGEDNND